VESHTGKPLSELRIEAWDKDVLTDDYLDFGLSDKDGEFKITFDKSEFEDWFGERHPDIYFKVFHYDDLLVSTEDSVLWNVKKSDVKVNIKIPKLRPIVCGEQHVYLKIERIEDYTPVKPQDDHNVSDVQYGRDCMRNSGHENGFIPQSEIDARALDAIVYREYLDSAYLIPKPDKLILADINEPLFNHRVPGTVIYTRPCKRLKIHVWNCDNIPHSLHVHGLRYGIDSDGSWPFGTEAAHHGGRSDAICSGESWTYTFDVTDEMLGVWPFHDHTHHMDMRIEHGLFGGIVVLAKSDKPPRGFRFRKRLLAEIYEDLERSEGQKFFPTEGRPNFDKDPAPFVAEPHIHFNRLKPITKQLLRQHIDFFDEFLSMELSKPRKRIPTDHVPVFFHLMSSSEKTPVFDQELDRFLTLPAPFVDLPFNVAGDYEYFCRHHPEMNGIVRVVPGGPANRTVIIEAAPMMGFNPPDVTVTVGGTVKWENHDSLNQHSITSKQGAAIPTHCINGRGFTGNSPTIVGRVGQRIRWYVFNLDTSTTWHNFHPHAMRWEFAGQNVDIRSIGPAESFIVEAKFPPVLLLTEEQIRTQDHKNRPKEAKLYHLKGDFVFHCHVHHHMMNGMIGLVRSKQSLWLTPDMAHEISHLTGLPLDNGGNACPEVDPHPCQIHGGGHWVEVAGYPNVLMMHSILLPNTERVLYWGRTRYDQSRIWDYSTPGGSYLSYPPNPVNQPADHTGGNVDTSNMWSAEHALLDTPEGLVLIHGGFSPTKSYLFNPVTLTWTPVNDTLYDRFYSTTLVIADGRAVTLFGRGSKTIEVYNHGVGWSAPINLPAIMHHHQYYPWTYLLPDGRLFIAGPHDPTQRFEFNSLTVVESFPTIAGERSTGGEKGSSVMLILRPPDYKPIIYIIGGNPTAAEKTAEQIDLSTATPTWTALPDINVPRQFQFTATLMPDGRVFIAGGIEGAIDGGPCEMFDPRNPGDGWVLGPNMKFARSYHSSFILLKDGSILGGGAPPDSDPPGTPNPTNIYTLHERFFPEYFDMIRPTISNAPTTIHYGSNFTINTPTPLDISEIILLRPGAVTHGFNMSQRGIECVMAGTGAGTIDVEAPSNASLQPPGWHLLFILDSNRIPSVGRWIRLTA
jgi:FtsP/CotA-like multicopper oxidase with cupredoxin domain